MKKEQAPILNADFSSSPPAKAMLVASEPFFFHLDIYSTKIMDGCCLFVSSGLASGSYSNL